MTQPPDEFKPIDPFGAWRGMRDAGLESWSKSMIELVNSDAFAQRQAAVLDAYLTSSAPLQQALQQAMTRVLTQLNMPTRSDVIGLSERLTNIELRLDDLEVALERAERSASKPQPAAPVGHEAAPTAATQTIARPVDPEDLVPAESGVAADVPPSRPADKPPAKDQKPSAPSGSRKSGSKKSR